MILTQEIGNLDDDGAVYFCYRLDGNLFNFRILNAHTKKLFCNLLFADNTALFTHTEIALQHLISCFTEAAEL